MAIIKSFTSLEQSKKLAEILPIESADMRIGNYVGKSGKVDGTNVHYYPKGESFGAPEIIDAWSLAALLGVLPRKVELEDTAYTIGVSLDNINYSNVNNGNLLLEVKVKDNLVDACYEVIIKLYELKML